ncbi:MAG: hypothetical protein R8J85_05370 [Mariprofundales bacterium]
MCGGGVDVIEADLIEKMKKIEDLFARAGTDGERMAAEAAIARMKKRIKQFEQDDPAVEYKFSLNNGWSRRLFIALLRRYDIKPYRRYRQRHTTVMANVSESFVNQTLWPEFSALDKALQAHLDEVTATIIAQTICSDTSDIAEVRAIE